MIAASIPSLLLKYCKNQVRTREPRIAACKGICQLPLHVLLIYHTRMRGWILLESQVASESVILCEAGSAFTPIGAALT